MPYFQRKPYAEMIAGAVQVPSADVAPPAGPAVPLLERAASILKEESTQLPKHPANPPVPMPGSSGVPGALPEGIVTLQPRAAVRPGQSATLVISVANESGEATVCTVSVTDLVSATGGRIGAGQVRISPRQAPVAAGAAADVCIAIDVPPGIAPGRYAGLLVVSGFEAVHALLTVSVIS
jgi:uncharacterized repeat protein (TIGR01451 family)